MTKTHPDNILIKKKYETYLRRAEGKSEKTIGMVLAKIDRYLDMNNHKSLKAFRIEQVTSFCERFEAARNPSNDELYSRQTVVSTFNTLRNFFIWLADQKGYGKVTYSAAQYFTPSQADQRKARATRPKNVPTVEQIQCVIRAMPTTTVIDRRNRALIAVTLLTGMRDAATASLKMRHVKVSDKMILQDGRDMNTKFNKTIPTFFFPVEDEIRQVFTDWVEELQHDHLFGANDPVFPKTCVQRGTSGGFEVTGLARDPWKDTNAIRKIFRDAFEAVDLPYSNPHAFRNTLALLGMELCKNNIPALKAWSQNLGHTEMLTTMLCYSTLTDRDQGRLLSGVGQKEAVGEDEAEKLLKIREILKSG